MSEPLDDLQQIADRELEYWRKALDRARLRENFVKLNNENPSIAVLDIDRGKVTAWTKAATTEVTAEEAPEWARRLVLYREFIAQVVQVRCPRLRTTLAFSMTDFGCGSKTIPVFSLQKQAGDADILFPDIDFLNFDFYEDPVYADARRYSDKRNEAIFVGSTTGVHRISLQMLADNTVPRIRAALYFKGNSTVKFLLPEIVQADSQETAEAIARLELGSARQAWAEKYAYRFLLSMDGNGATCSRVALALRSNSVLVKYESDCVLYYFSLLKPNVHYISVSNDHEVQGIVETEAASPNHYANIARNGQKFYETYLTRERIIDYAAVLLRAYEKITGHIERPADTIPNHGTLPIAPASFSRKLLRRLFRSR